MLAGHDRRNEGGGNVSQSLVRADDGRGREVRIAGVLAIFGWARAVELVGVEGQRSEADGHAGCLEVGGIERDDADGVLVIGQQVLNGHGGLLWRDIADCGC